MLLIFYCLQLKWYIHSDAEFVFFKTEKGGEKNIYQWEWRRNAFEFITQSIVLIKLSLTRTRRIISRKNTLYSRYLVVGFKTDFAKKSINYLYAEFCKENHVLVPAAKWLRLHRDIRTSTSTFSVHNVNYSLLLFPLVLPSFLPSIFPSNYRGNNNNNPALLPPFRLL